ncbi:MAG: glycosyl transferase, partial [Clostridiaceae bacterium]|nr:glycosyl transferase [Clostridiaceae bacterium]
MHLNYYILPVLALLTLSLIVWLLAVRSRDNRFLMIRGATLTNDELEAHAREIAYDHVVSKKTNLFNWPVPRMNENYRFIASVYKYLNEDVQKGIAATPAAEWLLDNFYIVEEQVKAIRRDLNKEYYSRLPMLSSGPLKGFARVYTIAVEMVSHTDGRIDGKVLINYINAYQSNNILAGRELWALAIMIKLALIENIRYLCEKIVEAQEQRNKVEEILSGFGNENPEGLNKLFNDIDSNLKGKYQVNSAFIEYLAYRIRKKGRAFSHVLRYIDERLQIRGTTIDQVTHKEHNEQTVRKGSFGNCITSLKFISNANWVEIFEELSRVEHILRRDPDGTYSMMDLASRNFYRKELEEIALYYSVSETHVANKLVELAEKAGNYQDGLYDRRKNHIGYYLIGRGLKDLENEIGHKISLYVRLKRAVNNHPAAFYTGAVGVITTLIAAYVAKYTYSSYGGVLFAVAGLISAVPAADIAVNVVNWLLNNIYKPSFLPKLELKDGIGEDLSTMVVIPALLPDYKRAVELIDNLEVYYLANREKNVYYALAGDFKDSSSKDTEGDKIITETALSKIKELNEKYADYGRDIFFFFHRHRQYNNRQNKWMGWERKRGALVEFNDMLMGNGNTSYSIVSKDVSGLPKVKYIITLDADTILPLGTAKKLIGTMAHPLNRPLINKERGTVVEGYGLLQPRIGFDIESVNKSLFSRIFAGEEGIDPYASAISDVYQDLFGEGIFTGKGIYDLGVFQELLRNAIPENAVLSHDLLEGSYIRAGLVTDLELIDGYPTKFNSYAMRLHRWVRGDWQLIPWLGTHTRDKSGSIIKNPLSLISRWKILDNLRRSLVAPSLMLLLFLGVTVFPGDLVFWAGFVLLTVFFPIITAGIDYIVSMPLRGITAKKYTSAIYGLKASFLQMTLMFVFLPYHAYLMADAIITTLIRVFVTKRNMLEWVTALDAERTLKNSAKGYVIRMKWALLQALLLFGLVLWLRPESIEIGIILFALWSMSPIIAYRVSKEQVIADEPLGDDERQEIGRIARKTWRYFEEFVNKRNNYLAPDNFQEDPPNGIAYRTSPTNIGLGMLAALTARDFGYIGTGRLFEIVSNTADTIDKMDKWNGHLYNWYDTRTLKTLTPRYVSTVDSGNFVCYLITLKEGLLEYLKKPLIEKALVSGIRDTANLAAVENTEQIIDISCLDTFLNSFDEKGCVDISIWINCLERIMGNIDNLSGNNGTWNRKLYNMLDSFKKEIDEFLPWAYILRDMPSEVLDYCNKADNSEVWKSITRCLSMDVPFINMSKACKEAVTDIEKLIIGVGQDDSPKHGEIAKWFEELKNSLNGCITRLNGFTQRCENLVERLTELSDRTEFRHLYDKRRQLFSIGFNIEENSLTNSYYDLLASEARQASYIAIARGEIDGQHWFRLGRTLTYVDRYKGMVSWSGTMFEYLMPLLIMKTCKNTLIDETYSFVVKSQIKYGKQRNVPWGTSESGFYSLDINLDYQYKAFGVPWLGLKRGLVEDMVVAPYATMLAILVDPAASIRNLKRLAKEGAEGPYGFYEALDYTPERLPIGSKMAVVKSYMAHHQGMSILALDNFLNGNLMQKRFHRDPVVDAAKLLLQEKVPSNVVFTKESKEKVIPFKDILLDEEDSFREYEAIDPLIPQVHILSNGSYSVMITDRGTGYSKLKTLDVTRWREDISLDVSGMFFYIRNLGTNEAWSATYAPFIKRPDKYKLTFTSGQARFFRKDGDIDTLLEIVVSAGDNAEIRRITLTNHGDEPCTIEVTSFFELVLAGHGADVAHPAFSNLFVRTEFSPELNSLIANRRPRSENEKVVWAVNTMAFEGEAIAEISYETDRMQFLGRGRNVSNPVVIEPNKPLSNTVGAVLDPIMSLRRRIKINPGDSAKLTFVSSVTDSREAALEIAAKYSNTAVIESEFSLSLTKSRVEARYLNLKTKEIELYQELISHILFISPQKEKNSDYIISNRKGQSALWTYGISGDIPIVLVMLEKTDEIDIVYEILKAHEYWKFKNLRVDLVLLNEEENSYTNPLGGLLSDVAAGSHAHDMINKPGGVFILRKSSMPDEDIKLLCALARVVLKGDSGELYEQLKVNKDKKLPGLKHFSSASEKYTVTAVKKPELAFDNGLGGFTKDGREYVVHLESGINTPLPWINVISNRDFGFIVTESGSGYTWYENSREYKLTPWSNDPVSDCPGEILYLSDNHTGEIWTVTPLPVREDEPYTIRHGFGYTVFEHESHGINQILTQFVPVEDTVKISLLRLENVSDKTRELSLTYYIRPVLGVSDQFSASQVYTQKHDTGAVLILNNYNEEFKGSIVFLDASIKERSVTGNRKEFFGTGSIKEPEG